MADQRSNEKENGASFFDSLPAGLNLPRTRVEELLLREYGSVFVARGVAVPRRIVFDGPAEVTEFQNDAARSKAKIGGFDLELQTPAMNTLLAAINDASAQGLSIMPRGPDSASRNYEDTVELWNSRVEPALIHWVGQGQITHFEADRIRGVVAVRAGAGRFRVGDARHLVRKGPFKIDNIFRRSAGRITAPCNAGIRRRGIR